MDTDVTEVHTKRDSQTMQSGVSNSGLDSVLVVLASQGTDICKVLEEASIERHHIESFFGKHLSLRQYNAFWNACQHVTGDLGVAMNVTRLLPLGAYNINDYLLSSAETLGHGLKRYCSYYGLLYSGIEPQLREFSSSFIVEFQSLRARCLSPLAIEHQISLLHRRVQQIIGGSSQALGVALTHEPQAALDTYQQIFGVTPKFGAVSNSITYPKSLLNCYSNQFDGHLSRLIEERAQSELFSLEKTDPDINFKRRVYQALSQNITHPNLSVRFLSEQLGMSTRTLQRRLKAHQLSYSEVLARVRLQEAKRLLEGSNMSLSEVARRSGYTEISAFYRSFKHAMGTTPRRYRQSGQSECL